MTTTILKRKPQITVEQFSELWAAVSNPEYQPRTKVELGQHEIVIEISADCFFDRVLLFNKQFGGEWIWAAFMCNGSLLFRGKRTKGVTVRAGDLLIISDIGWN